MRRACLAVPILAISIARPSAHAREAEAEGPAVSAPVYLVYYWRACPG